MDLKTLLDTPPWEWPSDAARTFRNALIDRRANAGDRLIAARLAGDFTVISDDLADALMAIVRNAEEPEELRARAAISFGAALEHAYINEFDDPDDTPITERTFRNIQDLLQELFLDPGTPKEVRRRILEASVRAPEDWHKNAISSAYASGDQDWMLTAVFSMRWIRGFDRQILESLKSANPEIQYEAVSAAGQWEFDAAWSHIVSLVENAGTPKPLLLAAMDAAANIRPGEAEAILGGLTASRDEEIAEAAHEAIEMAQLMSGKTDDEEDSSEDWIN
ncbi:MAG TPA: hypothetical protein VIX89_15830 [Bryobacteraceae bacterium]